MYLLGAFPVADWSVDIGEHEGCHKSFSSCICSIGFLLFSLLEVLLAEDSEFLCRAFLFIYLPPVVSYI